MRRDRPGPPLDHADSLDHLGWRIETLVRRYGLAEQAATQLLEYAACLATDPVAPTTVRDVGGIVEHHLADSLIALDFAPVRAARRIADIGSGAGLPGIPLAIALPDAQVTLVESNGRKAEFLYKTLARCAVRNVDIAATRAETWPEGLEQHDLLTARAVDHLSVVAEYAAPLLQIEGWLVAWRGRRSPVVEAEAADAAALLGLEPRQVAHVSPFPGAQSHHLHLMQKVGPTPARFPRRPGMARKRPLGAGSTPRSERS